MAKQPVTMPSSKHIDSDKKMFKKLEKIYSNYKSGFSSSTQLHRTTKIPISVIRRFLRTQRTATLHRPARRTYKRRMYNIQSGLFSQMGIDLIVLPKLAKFNDNCPYILVLIDVLSKYAYGRCIQFKNIQSVLSAIIEILDDEIHPGKVQVIHGDKEGSFISGKLKNKLKQKYNIKVIHSDNDDIKCSIVERFIRTFKSIIFKFITSTGQRRYIDNLQDLLENYNNRFHSTIQMSPSSVNASNTELAWANMTLHNMKKQKTNAIKPTFKKKARNWLYKRPESKFKIGDYVRISFVKGLFSKSYTQNWSEQVYKICKVTDHGLLYTYDLIDPYMVESEPLKGQFYAYELQHVTKPDIFQIQDVIDLKCIGPKIYALTKWLGYPSNFNSYRELSADDVKGLSITHKKLVKKLKSSNKSNCSKKVINML